MSSNWFLRTSVMCAPVIAVSMLGAGTASANDGSVYSGLECMPEDPGYYDGGGYIAKYGYVYAWAGVETTWSCPIDHDLAEDVGGDNDLIEVVVNVYDASSTSGESVTCCAAIYDRYSTTPVQDCDSTDSSATFTGHATLTLGPVYTNYGYERGRYVLECTLPEQSRIYGYYAEEG